MSDSEPSRPTVLLRIAVLWLPCAFWTVAMAIPADHPDQDTKGCALFFLWVGQVVCAYALARHRGRRGWAWALAALLTFTIAPAALAFMGSSGGTVRTVNDFRCDGCGAVTAGPVDAVVVCKECGWQAR